MPPSATAFRMLRGISPMTWLEAPARPAPRGVVEAAQVGLLEPHQLDVLDAADRLAGDAEAFSRLATLPLQAEAGEAPAHPR